MGLYVSATVEVRLKINPAPSLEANDFKGAGAWRLVGRKLDLSQKID